MFKITLMISAIFLTAFLNAQTPDEAINFMENEEGIGVKATALGNAFTAVADDYSAIYWNPAGLALLSRSEITGDLYHLNLNNEASFSGTTQIDRQIYTKLRTLGLAYKFPTTRGSFVFGLGYHRFKNYDSFLHFSGFNSQNSGLAFELEDDWGNAQTYYFDRNVLQSEDISENGNLSAFALGAGLAMSPSFNLGATIQFITGKYQYLFDFYQDDIYDEYFNYPADFYAYELHQDISTEFSGVGLKLGGLFHVNDEFRLGASVDLPTDLRIHETWSESDALIFDDDYISEMDLGTNDWEYIIHYPLQISGGAALTFKQLLLAVSCNYRDWTQVKFEKPGGYDMDADYSDLLSQNPLFSEQFRPVLAWGVGAELRVPGSSVKLRGGYRVVPSPLYDADPSLNKRYFSGGIGICVDAMSSLHITYVRGVWNRDTVDGYTPGGTHETIKAERVLAGLTLRLN
ncbi:outer membrane protein transport protein [bacterium]|nr:outer membrane protein transport protein [bacterium]